jgi:hypothetical protein
MMILGLCGDCFYVHKFSDLRPSRLQFFEVQSGSDLFPVAATVLEGPRGPTPLAGSQVSPKLCFTLGVAYHMIVLLVVSSPACFPNGKVGIMDSDLSQMEHNSAGHTIVAILLTQEEAAC